MTLDEIKQAIRDGKKVYWSKESYEVIRDSIGQYLICHENGNIIGLTWRDGVTLNGREDQFFTK